jgi:hypothetical protein
MKLNISVDYYRTTTYKRGHAVTQLVEELCYKPEGLGFYEGKSISKLQMDIELKQIRVLI